MAIKHAYDTDKKIIYITQAPTFDGTNWTVEYDVKIDLYSDTKEDMKTLLDGFVMPVASTGGDDLPGDKALGATFFLEEGWRIRPYEGDHVFRVNGNLYTREGDSPFIQTTGTYNVMVESTVSSLVDSTVQQLKEIEHAAFEYQVAYDAINGVPGIDYPTGTKALPSDNWADVKTIADYRGFNQIYIANDAVLDSNEDFAGFVFQGQTHVNNTLVIDPIGNVQNAVFTELAITGTLDGGNDIRGCVIKDLQYVNGHIHGSGLLGTITLAGAETAVIMNCVTLDANDPPIINMGGTGQDLSAPNYSGLITIENLTGPNKVGIGLNAGAIVLDSVTVTQGFIHVSGVGTLEDEGGNPIYSGTWNGGVTIINTLVNTAAISYEVWEELIVNHILGFTGAEDFSELLVEISRLTGNKVTKAGNVITIYEEDETTPWRAYDLIDGGRVAV